MTSEEKILERLEAIEGRLAALQERGENSRALMEQLTPIGNHAFRLLVEELECLNGRVSLDDILDLGRKGLLSVPKLTWLLDQLENLSTCGASCTPGGADLPARHCQNGRLGKRRRV
jgi:hypothetical protein